MVGNSPHSYLLLLHDCFDGLDDQQQDERAGTGRQHHDPERHHLRLDRRFRLGQHLDLVRLDRLVLRFADVRQLQDARHVHGGKVQRRGRGQLVQRVRDGPGAQGDERHVTVADRARLAVDDGAAGGVAAKRLLQRAVRLVPGARRLAALPIEPLVVAELLLHILVPLVEVLVLEVGQSVAGRVGAPVARRQVRIGVAVQLLAAIVRIVVVLLVLVLLQIVGDAVCVLLCRPDDDDPEDEAPWYAVEEPPPTCCCCCCCCWEYSVRNLFSRRFRSLRLAADPAAPPDPV
uniref:Uncharacterized protein n=1 Tax=Anopheles merus TaxID=30066 RepID=A0A182UWE3_ANOME